MVRKSLATYPQLICLLLFLITCGQNSVAQDVLPGESIFGTDNYIEYIKGNLPIIISVPHGGDLRPSEIKDRNCSGCVYVKDSFTQELSREILDEILQMTGCYPHVIINRLHRIKLDANREVVEATDGDPISEIAWNEYHDFLELAETFVDLDFGKGLFIDLHGHGHDIQRLELGYLLSKSDLMQSDNTLNGFEFIGKSSIASLEMINLPDASFSDLIRGDYALGTYLRKRGHPSVPSDVDPFPLTGEPYFTGGYNTMRYGSVEGGAIDAIQLECNQDVRFEENTRQDFALDVAYVLLNYVQVLYIGGTQQLCNTTSQEEPIENKSYLYPNPLSDFVYLNNLEGATDFVIYNLFGEKVWSSSEFVGNIDFSNFEGGIYLFKYRDAKNRIRTHKLIKQ